MGAGVEKAHPWWLCRGCAVRNPPKSSEGGSGPVLGLEMAWPTRSKCLCVSPRTTVGLGSGGPPSKDPLPRGWALLRPLGSHPTESSPELAGG